MRRKRNTAGIPYSAAGGFGAFTLLVAAIVMVVLAAAYADSASHSGNRATQVGNRGELVSSQDATAPAPAGPAARAARARAAALRRAQVAVRRAAARRAAARRAVLRARRRETVTVIVTRRSIPVYSGAGQNLCAPHGSGGGRAGRLARRVRAMQRRQALYNLNLHC